MSAPTDWLERHAIDPAVLDLFDVVERDGWLVLPNGRQLSLNGSQPKVKQPAGQGLGLWWPNGEPTAGEWVLFTEGESDALAVLSVNRALKVAVMPGCGYPTERLAEDLRGFEVAILAFDGDKEGRKKTQEAAWVADVPCHDLGIEDGLDLADCLAALPLDERAVWLRARLDDARPVEHTQNGGEKEQKGSGASRTISLEAASQIRSEPMRWLWQTRIPLRGLTCVAGEKGLGKSLLTNALLAADVTRGKVEGELYGHPKDVLVVTAEDDWRSIVKPRLEAHGADLERVHRVKVCDESGETLLTLPDDVGLIEEQIKKRDVGLIVIDPIGAFIHERTNSNSDAPVRRVLAPLAQLADHCDLAIVVVMHLTKDESRRVLQRVTGNGAFVNACRSVVCMVKDPDDPKGEQGNQRLLVHVATNWGTYAPTLAMHVDAKIVSTDDGGLTDIGLLEIDGESDLTVEDIQGDRNEHEHADDAAEAVGAALADGPRPSLEVKKEVADQLGCSRKTVQRAAMRMRDRGELTITEGGFPRTTSWELVEPEE